MQRWREKENSNRPKTFWNDIKMGRKMLDTPDGSFTITQRILFSDYYLFRLSLFVLFVWAGKVVVNTSQQLRQIAFRCFVTKEPCLGLYKKNNLYVFISTWKILFYVMLSHQNLISIECKHLNFIVFERWKKKNRCTRTFKIEFLSLFKKKQKKNCIVFFSIPSAN